VFGILHWYEGHQDTSELAPAVYRIDPQSGAVAKVADGIPAPNGLAFSPDESVLYIIASRAEPNRKVLAFDVAGGGRLARERVFIDAGPGATPDGFRVDVDGKFVVRLGGRNRRTGRGAGVQPGRRANRAHRPARALRQSVFRRALPQPAVHGGEPWAVFALCLHARRSGG